MYFLINWATNTDLPDPKKPLINKRAGLLQSRTSSILTVSIFNHANRPIKRETNETLIYAVFPLVLMQIQIQPSNTSSLEEAMKLVGLMTEANIPIQYEALCNI